MAWELGGGLGHVARLARLAKLLLDRGAEVLVATRPGTNWNWAFAVSARYGNRFRLINAPVVDPQDAATWIVAKKETLADALVGFGYDRPELVFQSADLWNSIMARLRPDLVISDSAPSLNLTAAGRVPLVCVGPPFLVPPRGRSLPPLRLGVQDVSARGRRQERRVLETVNLIRRANRLPSYQFCSDVWHGDLTFVAGPPDLDPHAWDTSRIHAGPFDMAPAAAATATQTDVYIYLPRSAKAGRQLVQHFTGIGLSCIAYVGGGDAMRVQEQGAIFLDRPAALLAQLAECRLFAHEGGLASTWAALRTETPQLILPLDAEKANTAALAARLSPDVFAHRSLATERLAKQMVADVEACTVPARPRQIKLGQTCTAETLIHKAMMLCGPYQG
ncbi:hypothetical protein [Amaricoccus sp.]|uniref:hypothetical protein n=1 Tax=Amaricoccus sp. TaxID=1872485 RepID=UPI002C5FCF5E|nr:hypothetical protein [Amaricoccus sp.]HMR36558.1 hypothetical protein [Paracoccus sp. (in: a-proteobacteria)]HMR53450.1 hypothetical protein [Amaricoccus sp.]